MSNKHIIVSAYPQKPEIIPQETVVPQNSSITLECTGNVGYPPAELQWFQKSTNEKLYTLVQQQGDPILMRPSTCLVLSKKYLKIRVKTEGTYRCAAQGSLVSASDPRYYGEVTVRIAGV